MSIEYEKHMFMWGLLWRSENRLDGKTEHLIMRKSGSMPQLFKTRKQAREYKKTHYSYIANRANLKIEPHGWKPVQVVKVNVSYLVWE